MIHFKLKNTNEIKPVEKEHGLPINFYFLSDGYLWLKFEDTILFEYTKEAMLTPGNYEESYSDYYLLRFIIDFTALFKNIGIPVSKQLYDLANDISQYQTDTKKWLDTYDAGSDNDYPKDIYEKYLQLNSWIDERTMDSGHLIGGPHLSFFRFDNKIKVVWRTEHISERGNSLWTAKNGFYEMHYIDFIEYIKEFFHNFFVAMEKQIDDVCKLKTDTIYVDKSALLNDQEHLRNSFAKDISLLEKETKNKTNWKPIEMLNEQMQHVLTKPMIWQMLETAAPATFLPYSNLEDKQFPNIPVTELFRLRAIKKEYLIALANAIKAELQIEMLTEFDAYGSGYASFVSIFLYPAKDVFLEKDGGGKEIEGVLIYISIEVPAYSYGKFTLYNDNSLQFQSASKDLEEELDVFWIDKISTLNTYLDNSNFIHLELDFIKQEPDFNCSLFTDIPFDGIFNKVGKTRIFDLFFHWAS